MKNIDIITARGGSKRIPRKNIKNFLGKPIICYSIEAAINSGLFDEVMVSTDDEEIADIAKRAGASVPFMRSEATANDFATTDDVLFEVLREYEKRGMSFDYMACLYPTAPFITADKLKNAMETLNKSDASGLMPVVPFSFPPQRGMIERDGRLQYQFPENAMKRSQDLEPIYHDCGQFYIYDVKKYLAKEAKVDDDYIPFVMKETEIQDIDNETDWALAEMKYRLLFEERGEYGKKNSNWK